MMRYDVIVIGGGPAGLMAAIFAKRKGKNVLICEKMPKPGKKLLVTGAGRCNLLNDTLDTSFYHPGAEKLVASVLEKFGKEAMLGFFKELGLATYADETGRIFPATNQAASVLKIFEMELKRLKIPIELNCEVKNIHAIQDGFELKLSKTTPSPLSSPPSQRGRGQGEGKCADIKCNNVILCAGGKSYPALGADGNGYALAAAFGHTILEPVPSTVPLTVKDPWCHFLQGQKIRAAVTSFIQGKKTRTASGELLFTQYGLSGTAILDISEEISVAMNREHIKGVAVKADMVPFMEEKELRAELSRRSSRGFAGAELTEGLLPPKIGDLLRRTLKTSDPASLAKILKEKEFQITGTRGWNQAEFTAGGIPPQEVDPATLESNLQKRLYLAGEILDVGGRRGGYNLAWAWASGAVAGSEA
ncbi:MAG TPA: NAD(P)/FAD-dependent oxidoreductase [Candidatus Omnitrophota bacterium]|nr:NAD(P)/FAD-dependent oxidoreductase [Candidatus Omnitrophota bacterium]